MDPARLVIASNRGPVSFARDRDGRLVARRGGGGLVASLGPLVAGTDATWVAAAMGDADREAAADGVAEADGFRFRCLDIDPATYRAAYDVVANSTLWFLHHHLWDLPRRPRFDRHWREAWEGYRAYNEAFARALADEAPDGATVLVQDYHLCLVAPKLVAKRPDLRPVHFHHTPFCSPEWLEVLPDDVATELIEGLAAYDACGFHSPRWEAGFRACADRVLGSSPPTFVAPLPPAAASLERVAASEACAEEGRRLEERVGDRRLIVRVDRMEPSKNIVRGFFAYDELLAARAELREKVSFFAFCYPSREGLAEYLGYHREVEAAAEMVNGRWGTESWTPVVLFDDDNFPRSVAALQRYDVLLVNPVRDGMNLVALEGPVVNRHDGIVALSRQAGAWDVLSGAAEGLNPFDVAGTAEALGAALDLPGPERRERSGAIRERVGSLDLHDWLDTQVSSAR
ncbi:MAG TPA: trehalose-6-phosphate synthase [Acidimicrobiales bacterium]|nr:trehalose-6-phosphate synthase [Acidimicrobiales bacterium]